MTAGTGAAGDPDVAVVIVSYRCAGHVRACLDALGPALGGCSAEIVVVDNDPPGRGDEGLAGERPDVNVIVMGHNAGFSRAVNRGIAATTARHVLLLNPDAVAGAGTIERLVRFADAAPGAGAVAPALVNRDGSDQPTARAFPTPAAAVFGRRSPLTRAFPRNRWSVRFLTGREHGGDAPFAVDWVSGACMLVPRSVIDRVGPLDEGFFLYWEDADWCRRIKGAGYGVWCVPAARVVHDEGGSRAHRWPAPAVGHFHRGAYRYWTKHHAPQPWNPLRWLAAGALTARGTAVAATSHLRRHRPGHPGPGGAP